MKEEIKELVPVVVYQRDMNYNKGMYKYQVFVGEYCRKTHTVKNVSKDYENFETVEEVDAYVKGLENAKYVYEF